MDAFVDVVIGCEEHDGAVVDGDLCGAIRVFDFEVIVLGGIAYPFIAVGTTSREKLVFRDGFENLGREHSANKNALFELAFVVKVFKHPAAVGELVNCHRDIFAQAL